MNNDEKTTTEEYMLQPGESAVRLSDLEALLEIIPESVRARIIVGSLIENHLFSNGYSRNQEEFEQPWGDADIPGILSKAILSLIYTDLPFLIREFTRIEMTEEE